MHQREGKKKKSCQVNFKGEKGCQVNLSEIRTSPVISQGFSSFILSVSRELYVGPMKHYSSLQNFHLHVLLCMTCFLR